MEKIFKRSIWFEFDAYSIETDHPFTKEFFNSRYHHKYFLILFSIKA